MKEAVKNLYNNSKYYFYAAWLGASLGAVFGSDIFDPKFWIVLLPTCLFVAIFHQKKTVS